MADAAKLTAEQRDTLNAAEQILRDLLLPGEVIMTGIHAGWDDISVSYWTPGGTQHTSLYKADVITFADKIDYALELRAFEAANSEQYKSERIAKLKAELTSLERAA